MSTVAEPALAALLLGKVSQARDHGVELTVTEESVTRRSRPRVALTQGELVTLVGNLVDNAIDAARADSPGWVEVTVRGDAAGLTVAVADSGPGMSTDAFEQARMRGYSTKGGSRGLGLALVWQVVAPHGGTITSENTYGSVIIATIPAPVIARS